MISLILVMVCAIAVGWLANRLGAAAAQREALIKLWRNGEIGDDVLLGLEREIDLAEARLARED